MAVVDPEEPDPFTNKKRKRERPQRKLLVNQPVEVRILEDGFAGSWHSGVVIACDSKRGHHRHVRYDHLLADDESGKLVDVLTVSPILDGIDSGKIHLNKNYRGIIRPLPPKMEFTTWGLHYGLCVDAYYHDAWWEGVVFDHDDGSPERKIFFPDLGDEMKLEIDSLRTTQDWNEVTEDWKLRGHWTFLELIEEFEKESFLPVSVKQIWYDMRDKKDFKKVQEWTCTEKELWKKIMCEVIDDYLNIIVKEFCPTSEFSEDSLPEVMAELESAQPGKDVNIYPQTELIGSHDVLPVDNPVKSDAVIDQGAIVMNSLELAQLGTDINVDPEAELIGSRDVLPFYNPVNKDGVIDQEAIVKNALESAQPGTDVNMNLGAELNYSYAIVPVDNAFNGESVANVVNFFDYSDWIIDESLQICDGAAPAAASVEPARDPVTSVVDNDESNMNLLAESNRSHHNEALCSPPQALLMLPSNDAGISRADSDSHGVKGILCNTSDTINAKLEKQSRRIRNWLLFSSEILPGAEFCPQAVDEYYAHYCREKPRKSNSLKIAVWKHLLYLGWKCESLNDKGLLRRRYTSPDGRCFYSLRVVCKHLKESAGNTASQDDLKRAHPLSNVPLHFEQPEGSLNPDRCFQAAVPPSLIEDNLPDYFHHPVKEYYLHVFKKGDGKNGSKKRLAARNYLFAVGWKSVVSYRSSGRKIVRYKAPRGKVHSSLLSACKVYLDEELSESAASACTLVKGLDVTGGNGGCSTSYMPSPMGSGWDFQPTLVQPNNLSKKISGECPSVAGLRKFMKPGKVKVQGIRKTQRKRNGNLIDINLHARRDGLKNSSKKDGKLSHSKNQKSSLPKMKKSKKSGALIRNTEDDTQPKRVLRSSKCVQEVITPDSSHHNPQTVLSWLIDNNMVLPRAKVQYRCRKDQHNNMVKGRITRKGIKCSCCQQLFTLIGFEVHARSNYKKPDANIFLEDGRSLLDCQRQIIDNCKKQSLTTESHDRMKSSWHRGENDYICSVCHYGGELMLCDSCPSSFHRKCLGLEDIPDGDWFCPSCCCGICGERNFQDQEDVEHTNNGNLICAQCERKYHVGCMSNKQSDKLEICHAGNWFCTEECKKIFLGLQKLLGKPFTLDADNLTWCLLKSMKTDSHSTDFIDDASTVSYSKLNVALNVMHECFEPVKEPRTGRDLVEDIIFNRGSDLKRLNFKGFYTVLLVRNDELITVATVRVYGQKVAEVPLVGTRLQYRRHGMCRILMNELEKKLVELGVERLVLPAVPSVLNTWTTSFGFSRMTSEKRLEFLDYTFLDFQGTIMCQKQLLSVPSVELSTLKEVKPKFHDDIDEAGDRIDCDRFGAVSKANRIEDQGQLEISADNNSDSSNNPPDMVVMVKQTQKLEFGPGVGETSQVLSMKDAKLRRAYDMNGEFYLKCYKRRKKPITNSFNVPAFA